MKFAQNIPLSDFSNYKIGGPASFFLELSQKSDLSEGLGLFRIDSPEGKIFILGRGTNVLIPDAGFDGLVIFNNITGISKEGNIIKASSGTLFSDLVRFSKDHSLSGLEWAGGLPGTVGGAVRGNAGAFGGEAKDSIVKATSISLSDFSEIARDKEELNFSYRNSIFKNGEGQNEFILDVWFELKPGDPTQIERLSQEKIDYRKERHPMELPNIGSTFKNIPVEEVSESLIEEYGLPIKNDPFPIIPVAKLLSIAGLKGKTVKPARKDVRFL